MLSSIKTTLLFLVFCLPLRLGAFAYPTAEELIEKHIAYHLSSYQHLGLTREQASDSLYELMNLEEYRGSVASIIFNVIESHHSYKRIINLPNPMMDEIVDLHGSQFLMSSEGGGLKFSEPSFAFKNTLYISDFHQLHFIGQLLSPEVWFLCDVRTRREIFKFLSKGFKLEIHFFNRSSSRFERLGFHFNPRKILYIHESHEGFQISFLPFPKKN